MSRRSSKRLARRNAGPIRTVYVAADGALFKLEGKRVWDAILNGAPWQSVARALRAEYNYATMRWTGLPDALAHSAGEGSRSVYSTRSGVEVVRMDEADEVLPEIARSMR
jgi:hypothetical protein